MITPVQLLEQWRDSLPDGHPEKIGAIRAVEVLRADMPAPTEIAHSHLTERALDAPVSAIKDGWTLVDGDLSLIVEIASGHWVGVTVPRYKVSGERRTSR